jgi:hypothetical protein
MATTTFRKIPILVVDGENEVVLAADPGGSVVFRLMPFLLSEFGSTERILSRGCREFHAIGPDDPTNARALETSELCARRRS